MRNLIQFLQCIRATHGIIVFVLSLLLLAGGIAVLDLTVPLDAVRGAWRVVLDTTAFVLLGACYLRYLRKLAQANGPILKISHGSVVLNEAGVRGDAWALLVSNEQHKRTTTAHNLKASVTLRHFNGDIRRYSGVWYVSAGGGRNWFKQPSLSLGDAPIHLLLFRYPTNQPWEFHPIEAESTNINAHGILQPFGDVRKLEHGEWKVTVEITGSNILDDKRKFVAILGPKQVGASPLKRGWL